MIPDDQQHRRHAQSIREIRQRRIGHLPRGGQLPVLVQGEGAYRGLPLFALGRRGEEEGERKVEAR